MRIHAPSPVPGALDLDGEGRRGRAALWDRAKAGSPSERVPFLTSFLVGRVPLK